MGPPEHTGDSQRTRRPVVHQFEIKNSKSSRQAFYNYSMIKPKRLIITFCAVLMASFVTLAFIPHYGCACGEIVKQNGSQLSYLPQTIAEFIFKVIDAIF
jgi:hypothetical protein